MMHEIGPLLKRLRTQRKITQEVLAWSAGIDRATLSKIETGKATPNNTTLLVLFEKLGYDALNIGSLLLSKEEAEWQRVRVVIEAHISRAEYDAAAERIAELESQKSFADSSQLKHMVMHYKGQILLHTGKPPEALTMFKNAITQTIPSFDEGKIGQYYFSNLEILTINMLSSAYGMSGQIEKAIEIIAALKENFDENCLDRNMWGKFYPIIIYHLTRYLCLSKKFEEALAHCEVGRKASIAGYSTYLPYIALNEAYCHAELGNKEKGEELFRQAYYAFNLFQLPANAEAVKRDAKKYVDVEL